MSAHSPQILVRLVWVVTAVMVCGGCRAPDRHRAMKGAPHSGEKFSGYCTVCFA